MRRTVLVMALLLISGCGPQASQPEPLPPAPVAQPQPNPQDVRASKLTATLRSATGKQAKVYLYATDEQAAMQDAPSCMAAKGDTIRTGHYSFYLQPAGHSDLQLQSLTPFGDPLLSFNDQRPNDLQVMPGESGHPDLLLLMQYGSCNGNALAVLALSPDGDRLIQYLFKSEDGQARKTTGTKDVERRADGTLQTTIYNNATGKWTTTHWAVQDDSAVLISVAS